MARLMGHSLTDLLLRPAVRVRWELRRATRTFGDRFGVFGWAMLGAAVCLVAGAALARHHAAQRGLLETRLAARLADNAATAKPLVALVAPGDGGWARARLKAFDAHLLPHGAIPFVVQDLLDLGEAEGLSMQRGSYRPQVDTAGGFLRYRMTLPVKGAGPAIQRFMKAALRKEKNLALDSVQFKRARIGATDIEARIQWVMLTTLPSDAAVAAANAGDVR